MGGCACCSMACMAAIERRLAREERLRWERSGWPDRAPALIGQLRPAAARPTITRRLSPTVRHRSRQVRLYVGR